jgi:signal transduction histidine kinase
LIAKPGLRRDQRVQMAPSGKINPCIIIKSKGLTTAGEVDGMITTVTDITELKRTEESLIQAKQTAKSAMRARAQVLANMSYDTRTPMNGVLGMASVMEETPLIAEHLAFLATIKRSGESLLRIVGDILDF